MELCDHICYRRLTRLSTVARCSTYSWFLSLALTEGDANRARWLEKYIHENIWEIWEMHPHHLDHGFLLLPWWHCSRLLWEPSHLQPLIRPHQRQCFLSAILCLISCRYHSVRFMVQLIKSLYNQETRWCVLGVPSFYKNCVSLTMWQEQMVGVLQILVRFLQIHAHCS